MTSGLEDHRARANALRQRVTSGPGKTTHGLRAAVAERVAGGPEIDPPYDALAAQIASAAYRVTDDQVGRVREVVGSDKATFEVVATAAVAAGLLRWDIASRVLDEASK